MTPEALMEDLERRRDLAGELARYADGSQGLGLGTALAGGMALLNPVIMVLGSRPVLAYAQQQPRQAGLWEFVGPLLILCISVPALFNAFAWLLLKDAVQVRVYCRHGEARSAPPAWEVRTGLALLGMFVFAGVWIGGGAFMALRVPQAPRAFSSFPILKTVAGVAILGTSVLIAAAWRWIRGWRNWLGWTALCAPFLLFISAPLFNDPRPGLTGSITVLLLLSFFAAFLYLPFMALYVGIRDHLHYRRLLKELAALPSMEAQP
ncbi:MAG TPA: hypothetical protein VJ483_05510 [Holophagaceae bacterium]|nr:hypothetical protein [Holophagaceae bacterium]